ncbi:hypothetical protein GCM10009549_39730 [Streptomyces thermoalcalitolerans]|uniref:Uncharacterized protein n=1 Tax=Streptomyces thermoalcalitolerans TaxID=65605 RepID=A0ABP3ZEY5_9ACTN
MTQLLDLLWTGVLATVQRWLGDAWMAFDTHGARDMFNPVRQLVLHRKESAGFRTRPEPYRHPSDAPSDPAAGCTGRGAAPRARRRSSPASAGRCTGLAARRVRARVPSSRRVVCGGAVPLYGRPDPVRSPPARWAGPAGGRECGGGRPLFPVRRVRRLDGTGGGRAGARSGRRAPERDPKGAARVRGRLLPDPAGDT